jgi:hypothetical protein
MKYALLYIINCQHTLIGINVHGSVYRKNILIPIQQDAMLHSLFYLKTALRVSDTATTHYQQRK